MIKKLNHIGVAVKNLDEAVKLYQSLGLQVESYEEVHSQKVKIAFIPVGDTRIELLAATSEDSPIAKFIEKKGEGIQHLAFEVDNIEESLQETRKNNIRLIDESPREGAHQTSIAFLHPKSTLGTLIEFCQQNN